MEAHALDEEIATHDLRESHVEYANTDSLCAEDKVLVDLRRLTIDFEDRAPVDGHNIELITDPIIAIKGGAYGVKPGLSYAQILDEVLNGDSSVVKTQSSKMRVVLITRNAVISGELEIVKMLHKAFLEESAAECGDVLMLSDG